MPDFPSYTRDELVVRARNLIRLRLPSADLDDGTDYDVWARMLGTLAFGLQRQGSTLLRLIDPTRAFGAVLREFADSFGIGRELATSTGAVAATGKVMIVSTTGTQTQLAGSVLVHADGTEYTLDADADTSATDTDTFKAGWRSTRQRIVQGKALVADPFGLQLPDVVYEHVPTGELVAVHGNVDNADNEIGELYFPLAVDPQFLDVFAQEFSVVAAVTCSTPGTIGNKDPGDVLTIVSPAGTIVATARIAEMSGGLEAMTEAEQQAGFRDLLQERLSPMPLEEIRALALAAPGITKIVDATVFPSLGTYTIYPYQEGTPFVTEERAAEVAAYVDARIAIPERVVGATLTFRTDLYEAIEVRVQESSAPDWRLPAGAAFDVAAGSTTTRINTVLDTTDTIMIGDRVIVSGRFAAGTPSPYIVQREVAATNAAYIDLTEAVPSPPDAAVSFITPGGPAAQRVIDAVLEHYDEQRADSSLDAYSYPERASTSHTQGIIAKVGAVVDVLDVALNDDAQGTSTSGEVAVFTAIQIKMWS
jgi:uncharacterized phage protein gp47/JayE